MNKLLQVRGVKILTIFLILLNVLSFGYVVRAENDTPNAILVISGDTYGKILPTTNKAGNKVGNSNIVTFTAQQDGSYVMTFNADQYDDLSYDERTDYMKIVLGETAKNQSLAPINRNKVYNFFEKQDSEVAGSLRYLKENVTANFVEGRKWFEPFSNPISSFLGFGCIIIFTGLALSVVFDIVYITIPLIHPLLERGEENSKPWGVSNEAWKAQKEVEEPDNKRSTLQLYCRKRMPVFFITAAILAWLISGKIYDLVVYFVDWFNIL